MWLEPVLTWEKEPDPARRYPHRPALLWRFTSISLPSKLEDAELMRAFGFFCCFFICARGSGEARCSAAGLFLSGQASPWGWEVFAAGKKLLRRFLQTGTPEA